MRLLVCIDGLKLCVEVDKVIVDENYDISFTHRSEVYKAMVSNKSYTAKIMENLLVSGYRDISYYDIKKIR